MFYRDFSILLLLNAVWLATITFRQRRARVSPHDKHIFWQLNNFICGSLILGIFLSGADIALMFFVAIVNCVLDLWTCAPYYLESM